MTEREKMLSGALYDPTDPELTALREKAHRLSRALLLTPETEGEKVRQLLDELVPERGAGHGSQYAPVLRLWGVH